jgi:hypothetical protein
MFGENSSYVTNFLYLNWTEATKIEWKFWKWHRYFETISSLKHMLLTVHYLFISTCHLLNNSL